MVLRPFLLVLLLASAAAAQPRAPSELPADAYAAVRLALGEVGPVPTSGYASVALRVADDPETVDRAMQVAFAALGLAAGTTAAVVGWPFVFADVEGAEEGEPAAALAEGFRYGFVLPVTVAGTVLAGYSGYRLVVLTF